MNHQRVLVADKLILKVFKWYSKQCVWLNICSLRCGGQWIKQLLRIFGPELIRNNELIKTAWSAVLKTARSTVLFLRHQPRNFENMTLVARRRVHFRVFLAIFFVAQLSPKRGVLVHKNLLASCQRCRHSVEPRTLTCPFKQSDLIAWSLLIGHPTHKYLWGRPCFVHVCCLLSTVTVTTAETRIMSTEALFSKTVSVKIYTKHARWRNMVCRRSGWSSWTGDRT